MKKPEKIRYPYVYSAKSMDVYLLEKDALIQKHSDVVAKLSERCAEQKGKIALLEMANKNGNYTLMDKCDEFGEYVENTEKRIDVLRKRVQGLED